MDTVISLTSVPPRFHHLAETLESLLHQNAPRTEIRLYIPRRYARFPDWDGRLPDLPKGVRLCRCDDDFGPATKILPAAREFAGADVRILFCDDDRRYAPGWAETLLSEHDARPDDCVALLGRPLRSVTVTDWQSPMKPEANLRKQIFDLQYRAARARQQFRARRLRALAQKPPRRIVARAGYADVFRSFGGVVLPPDALPAASWRLPDCAVAMDDIWLSGMLALAGIPIWLPSGHRPPERTAAADIAPRAKPQGPARQKVADACIDYLRESFNIWRPARRRYLGASRSEIGTA